VTREYDKEGRLLNAAYHMRALFFSKQNEAIALCSNVVDLRQHHRGYMA